MTRGTKLQICAIILLVLWHGFYNSYSPTAKILHYTEYNGCIIEESIYVASQNLWWCLYYFLDCTLWLIFVIGTYLNSGNKKFKAAIMSGIIYFSILDAFFLLGIFDSSWFRIAILNYKFELLFTGLSFAISIMFYFITKRK